MKLNISDIKNHLLNDKPIYWSLENAFHPGRPVCEWSKLEYNIKTNLIHNPVSKYYSGASDLIDLDNYILSLSTPCSGGCHCNIFCDDPYLDYPCIS